MTRRELLPANRTLLEHALALVMANRVDASALRDLYSAERCPAPLLPWLAWSLSVDRFDSAGTEARQRALIASSIRVHRMKGTVASVRQVFRDLGLGEVTIDEGANGHRYDGAASYDGFSNYDDIGGWAEYRVHIDKLLSVEQALLAREILADVAPVRCQLWGLDFTGAELLYNNLAAYDGGYTYGVA
ncbi:phage tail protein I [Chitiniphilus shinanonensis]|uniref:phage tail protein I n=1 Tax=Chitiniphilus shinanonensis TaxID=553088 RepID=UPI00302772AB